VLCGEADREYGAMVRARIAALGLASRFRLPGFEKDVRSLLTHAELLVHPARAEGFGLAILEAMAAGKPVVATRSGGPEEIVEDGVSGLLVPAADPPALGAALGRVLGDAALASALARGARRRARRFTLAASARKTEEVYDGLLASDRGADARRSRQSRAESVLAELLSLAAAAAR